MARDAAKIAAVVPVVYVAFFVAGMFHHYLATGEEYTLQYSLSLASTWIAAGGGFLVAYGLWSHYQWAWWLALAGVTVQLIGMSHSIVRLASGGESPPFSMFIVIGLFVAFLLLLALPATRAVCKR